MGGIINRCEGRSLILAAQRTNRKEISLWRLLSSPCAAIGSWRALRPPDPPLEPADEAVHLRRAQRRPHPRPVADRAAVRACARIRLGDRPGAAARCCSSAPSARRRSRLPRRRALAASTSSTTAGWAACSPTGRPSRARSSASRRSKSSFRATPSGLTKKEVLQLTRERDKLELSLGGIRDMGGIPDVMFVIDANKEELAIKEANVLGIPVVAILDSNVRPARHRVPGSGQRRRQPRHPPLLRSDRQAAHQGRPRRRGRIRAPISARWTSRCRRRAGRSAAVEAAVRAADDVAAEA